MAQALKAPRAGETSSPRRPAYSPKPRPDRLWIAVYLPALALEALARISCQSSTATVVVEPRRGHPRVVVANETALERGITSGLKLSAAQALSRALVVLNRSAEAEHRELVSLACWVRGITPLVSLEPPQALLLEVGGSLKLWGGIDTIEHALGKELGRRRLTAHLCVAPTALAALWLARAGQEDVLSGRQLAGRLGALPLKATGWPDAAQLLLKKMGVRTVGDCLRLPREGFARRVGKRYLDDLDKSLGCQDLRAEFRPDRRFSSILEFQEEVTEPEVLANVGRKLIGKLTDALHEHQAQIASCQYGFHHLHRPATVRRINLVIPTYESKKITDLFLSQLETLSLPAPVTALSLTTGKSEPMVGLSSELFPACPDMAPKIALGELIARLRMRFSAEDIHGLALAEDHRPEAAWSRSRDVRAGPIAAVADSPECPRRPLWLLPAPVGVASADGGRKHLRLESGPERVEAGWWEGCDTSRDYYVASGSKGERLWVYRDRCCDRNGWYLHGIFG